MRSENPHPCFGREHGRNKGEFNSLGGRLGLILPGSLMLQRPAEPHFPDEVPDAAAKSLSYSRKRVSGRLRSFVSIAVPGKCGWCGGACHRKARLADPMTAGGDRSARAKRA